MKLKKRTEETKKRKKGKKVKKRIKEYLLYHGVQCVLLLIVISMLAPYFLLKIITLLDKIYFRIPAWLEFVRLEDGINVWFGFWGSYLGAITSLVLSVCAMRLSVKMDRENEKNAMVQQAIQFHQFKINNMQLYDLEESFPVHILEKFEDAYEGNYVIRIEFEDAFPVFFDVDIERIEWRDGEGKCESVGYKTLVHNNERFEIYISLIPNEEQKKDLKFFYHIIYYEPDIMCLSQKTRGLNIVIKCKNQMDLGEIREETMKFQLNLDLQNEDYRGLEYRELCIIKRSLIYYKDMT